MAKTTAMKKGFRKEDQTKKLGVKKTATKKRGRPANAATKVAQAAVLTVPQKNAFEERFGKATALIWIMEASCNRIVHLRCSTV